MFTAILRLILPLLAGVGISDMLDKFVKDKVPATIYPEPVSPGFRLPKLLWLIGAFVIGFLIVRFIGKKLNIKILK